MSNSFKNIEDIRCEIDKLDNKIIELISERFNLVKEIMNFKNNIEDVYAKERYNAVIQQRRKIAEQYNLNPDVIESIYRILMNYFIEEEIKLLKK